MVQGVHGLRDVPWKKIGASFPKTARTDLTELLPSSDLDNGKLEIMLPETSLMKRVRSSRSVRADKGVICTSRTASDGKVAIEGPSRSPIEIKATCGQEHISAGWFIVCSLFVSIDQKRVRNIADSCCTPTIDSSPSLKVLLTKSPADSNGISSSICTRGALSASNCARPHLEQLRFDLERRQLVPPALDDIHTQAAQYPEPILFFPDLIARSKVAVRIERFRSGVRTVPVLCE